MASSVASMSRLSVSCPMLSPLKKQSPDKTSAESSASDDEDIPRASKKQRLFARKLTQRDRKREKEQLKKHENNAISMDDFFSKQTEFRMWLTEEKKKKVSDLRSPKLKAYFKTFIKLWNKKKLPQKYYRGSVLDSPCSPAVPKFSLAESTPGKDLALFPHTVDLSLNQGSSPCLSDRPLSTFGKASPETPEEEDKENLPDSSLLHSGQLSDSITVRRKKRSHLGLTPVKGEGSLYKVTQLSWTSQGELHVRAVSPGNLPPSQEPCPPSPFYTLPPHQTPTLSPLASPSLRTRSKRQAVCIPTPTIPQGSLVVRSERKEGGHQGTPTPAVPSDPALGSQAKREAVEDAVSVVPAEIPWGTKGDGGQSSSGVSSASSCLSMASAEFDPPPGMVRMSKFFVFPEIKASNEDETASSVGGVESQNLQNSGEMVQDKPQSGTVDGIQWVESSEEKGKSHFHSVVQRVETATAVVKSSEARTPQGIIKKLPGTPRATHGGCSITMGSAMLVASSENAPSKVDTTAFDRSTPTRGSLIKTVPPRPNPKTPTAPSGTRAECPLRSLSAESDASGANTKGPSVENGNTGSDGDVKCEVSDRPVPAKLAAVSFASAAPRSPALPARSAVAVANPIVDASAPILCPYADIEVTHRSEVGAAWCKVANDAYAEPYDSQLGREALPGNHNFGTFRSNATEGPQFRTFGKAATGPSVPSEITVKDGAGQGRSSESSTGVGGHRGLKPVAPPKPPVGRFGRGSVKRRSPQQSSTDSAVEDVYAVPMKKHQQSGRQNSASAKAAPLAPGSLPTSPPPALPPKKKIYVIPSEIMGSKVSTTEPVHSLLNPKACVTPEVTLSARTSYLRAPPALAEDVCWSPADLREQAQKLIQGTPPTGRNSKEPDVPLKTKPGRMSPVVETSPVIQVTPKTTPSEVGDGREVPAGRTPPFSKDLAFVDRFLKRGLGSQRSCRGKKTGTTPSPGPPCSPEKKTRQAGRQETPTLPSPSHDPTPTVSPTPAPLKGVLKYGLLSHSTNKASASASLECGAARGGGRLRVGMQTRTAATTTTTTANDASSPPLVRGRRFHREQLERAKKLKEQEQRDREQRRRKLRRSVSHDDLAGFPLMKLDTSPRQAWRESHRRLQKNKSVCTLIN